MTKEKDTFAEDLEKELNFLFPKGKCEERGQALALFAYAVATHRRSRKVKTNVKAN